MNIQPHAESEVDLFDSPRRLFELVMEWLHSGACHMEHADVEKALRGRGETILRALYQSYLDLRSDIELREYRDGPKAPDVEVRRRERSIESEFGRVRLCRLGYKAQGCSQAEFPLDRSLNLPSELYSFRVRERIAWEAQRSSFDEAVATVQSTSGAHVPKRQAQQLIERASQDFDAFYELTYDPNNRIGANALNVASCDSKGVNVLDQGLRPETRKLAQQAKSPSAHADPMAPKKLRRHDKRMAIVTANWQQERQARTPRDILDNFERQSHKDRKKSARPLNKRVRASVQKSQAEGIEEMFDEIQRRDPAAQRETVVLVDGEEHQLEHIRKLAESRNMSISIVLDIIHVLHYLWTAGNIICDKSQVQVASWVMHYLAMLLTKPAWIAANRIEHEAANLVLQTIERERVDTCCQYILKNQGCMNYREYLAKGFPIATGVIEGACRHLVQDRMGITGARWDVPGAEAILKLRSLVCSGDWDDYLAFHLEQERLRNHNTAA